MCRGGFRNMPIAENLVANTLGNACGDSESLFRIGCAPPRCCESCTPRHAGISKMRACVCECVREIVYVCVHVCLFLWVIMSLSVGEEAVVYLYVNGP